MKFENHVLLIICIFFVTSVVASKKSLYISGTGQIDGELPGVVYFKGNSGKIFFVKMGPQKSMIFVQSLGDANLSQGEAVEYGGTPIKFNLSEVVNTNEGYLYRPDYDKIQEKKDKELAEKMERARIEREKSLSELQVSDPTALSVPIVVKETKAQIVEKEQEKEQQNYLTIIGILVGLLSIDKIYPFINKICLFTITFLRSIRTRIAFTMHNQRRNS